MDGRRPDPEENGAQREEAPIAESPVAVLPGLIRRWGRPKALRRVAAFGVVVFITANIITVVRATDPERSSEYRGFRRTARRVMLYGGPQHAPGVIHLRAYPPFFAIFFTPFSLGPPWLGAELFFLLGFGGYCAAVWWLCRTVWPGDRPPPKGLVALAWLVPLVLLLDTVLRCESDAVILAIVAAGLWLIVRERRDVSGGVLLGLAASIKVLPGLFGVYLLCRRQWRAAGAMALGGVLFTVLIPVALWGPREAWQRHREWYREVVAPYHHGGMMALNISVRPSNQSLTAATYRFLCDVPLMKVRHAVRSGMSRIRAEGSRAWRNALARERRKVVEVNLVSLPEETVAAISEVAHGVIALFFVGSWIASYRRHMKPHERLTLFATVPVATLLLSEVSLTTHHLLLVVPLVALLGRWAMGGDERRRVGRLIWCVPAFFAAMASTGIKPVKALSPMLVVTVWIGAALVILAVRDRRAAALRSKTS